MNKKQLKALVGGQFFTVTFTKKDGSSRTLNGRLGVQKFVKGNAAPRSLPENLVTVWESNGNYRCFYADKVTSLKCSGMVIKVKG